MSVLPEHPDLDQARRQAKELERGARGGDAGALARLEAVSAPLTLAGAQLALARELGQPSWAALVRDIEARHASIPETVVRFLRSSVNLQIGTAVRMLHEDHTLAQAGFPAAVVLGDVDARWQSPPLEWALVGSGEAPVSAPAPDWVTTVNHLLDAGASLDGITLDPREPKQPSAAVLELLRSRGG
jgi:hypothetical protein